jgi:hypothetical protein
MIAYADLENRFTYHKPNDSQLAKYVEIRVNILQVATLILELTPASREQSLAITKLEEAVFWANASIARKE